MSIIRPRNGLSKKAVYGIKKLLRTMVLCCNVDMEGEFYMSELDPKVKEMAAVAASIAGNCVPCLKYHFSEAVRLGCTQQELSEIIAVANKIKQRPIEDISQFAGKLLKEIE
jgi:AhpD family alkylhydroperoxidase